MKNLIFILSVLILIGCASSTVIKTIPEGAKIKQDGALKGVTPYQHWDRDISFASKRFTLHMEGYKDKEITITKDVMYIGRIFGPPVLAWPWLYGYDSEYFFELDKIKE